MAGLYRQIGKEGVSKGWEHLQRWAQIDEAANAEHIVDLP
jgi:hypothetical protein